MFDIIHTPGLLGWVIVQIELSDLIGFSYDLSDTQDGHRIYILW